MQKSTGWKNAIRSIPTAEESHGFNDLWSTELCCNDEVDLERSYVSTLLVLPQIYEKKQKTFYIFEKIVFIFFLTFFA
jgi:hypothetical protein